MLASDLIKRARSLSDTPNSLFISHSDEINSLWESWKDIQVLQNLLNHAEPTTTMRYLQQSGLKNIDYSREMQLGKEKDKKSE